jgi:hypothetical protein
MSDLGSLVFTLKLVPFPYRFDRDAHVEAVNRLPCDGTGPHDVLLTYLSPATGTRYRA